MKFASKYAAELALKSREIQLLEVELTAMRQRAEEAERQRDGYKNACNDVIGEMLAKDEQDRIGQHIAGLLSYTMIVQALPSGMVNAQALRKAVEAWREARKSVKADDISTVSSYRAERDAAIVRAERAEDALEDIKTTIEDQLDESPHGDDHVNCFLENLKMKANAALSSPPADATKMGGGRERRLADSLDEILNYSGGADNALEDEYVMERAIAALADMEQKS